MPKLGGSRYADLHVTEPQGVTPVYWQITNKSHSPREGGWEILKQNCYKLCTLVQAARIGPLHDPVTWYKITYAGEQVAQWDSQNKGRCTVLEVPLHNLLTSICNFVPWDRVVQRAHYAL